MKLSCQEDMIPGTTLAEKVSALADLGIQGIEITDGVVKERKKEIEQALKGTTVTLSTICIKPSSRYTNILGLLDPDRDERTRTVQEIKALIDVAGGLGAVGVIVVPIFGKPRIPDLSPIFDPLELEERMAAALLHDLAEYAEKAGTMVLLEPVHRYLTHYLTTIEHGVRLRNRTKSTSIALMVDIFQSLNEERDVMESIDKNLEYIRHFHISDNNRLVPGLGSTDFKRFHALLHKHGFSGYLAFECTKPKNLDELHASVGFLMENGLCASGDSPNRRDRS